MRRGWLKAVGIIAWRMTVSKIVVYEKIKRIRRQKHFVNIYLLYCKVSGEDCSLMSGVFTGILCFHVGVHRFRQSGRLQRVCIELISRNVRK